MDRPPTRAAAVANNALVCPVGTIYAGFAVRETTPVPTLPPVE